MNIDLDTAKERKSVNYAYAIFDSGERQHSPYYARVAFFLIGVALGFVLAKWL